MNYVNKIERKELNYLKAYHKTSEVSSTKGTKALKIKSKHSLATSVLTIGFGFYPSYTQTSKSNHFR